MSKRKDNSAAEWRALRKAEVLLRRAMAKRTIMALAEEIARDGKAVLSSIDRARGKGRK